MRGLRVLRGVAITALLWGIGWAIAGMVLATLFGLLGSRGADLPLLTASLRISAAIFGIIGALNGAVFALAVVLGERRRSFTELSARRMALWGLVGGVSYPLLFALTRITDGLTVFADWFIAAPLCGVLGAASAWTMLALARRASDPAPPMVGPGTPVLGGATVRAEGAFSKGMKR